MYISRLARLFAAELEFTRKQQQSPLSLKLTSSFASALSAMGLSVSRLLAGLFGKKEMRKLLPSLLSAG